MRQDIIQLFIGGQPLAGTNLSSSFISDPTNLFSIYAYSIQVSWAGGSDLQGTFTLEASDDPGNQNTGGPNSFMPTNWTYVTGSSQVIVGSPGNILYDVAQTSYRWVRVVYTATSGSATVASGYINVKGV